MPDPAPEPLAEKEQIRRRLLMRDLMGKTPYMSGLDIVFERYEPDDVVMRLPFREDLTNDGIHYHGGVIASMIDSAGSAAAWSNHDFDRGSRAATVSMSIQYVGTAKKSDLITRATTVKRGRELIFTEITATDDQGKVVAHGMLTYRIA